MGPRDRSLVTSENIGAFGVKMTKIPPYILDQKHHLYHFFFLSKILCGGLREMERIH